MVNKRLLVFSIFLILAFPATLLAQEYPSILVCKTNAWTARQYRDPKTMQSMDMKSMYREGWSNDFLAVFRPRLKNTMTDSNISWDPVFLKELVFANIQTRNPVIRKITEYPDGDVSTLESQGRVVNRFKDAVSFV